MSVSRKDFIDRAKTHDVALAFETAVGLHTVATARRGASGWSLKTYGKTGHSSRVFSPEMGYGSIYEAARILNEFREQLSSENQDLKGQLQEQNAALNEVVVIGYGESTKKDLTGSLVSVKSDNFVTGVISSPEQLLQGRVAGLTINPTSGLAGASSQIVLRGFNSLSLDNSPLFIIDGVIIDNSSVNENNRNTGLAIKPTSANVASENRSNDYTNRIADLNPNDKEAEKKFKEIKCFLQMS